MTFNSYLIQLFIALLMTSAQSCSKSDIGGEWLIPKDEVLSGGPGKDGIPALTNPDMVSIAQVNYMNDEDLIIGFKDGDEVKGYTHVVLDWHEIINDVVGDKNIAVTYCPLTGTGIGWNRTINGSTTTFGVSGLLYNTNLIPYDRETDSNWSQIRLDCVNGDRMGAQVETLPIVEMNWKTWKTLYPNSEIVSLNTGINRSYGRYPYGSYRTDNSLNFPISTHDNRLHRKERVLGVINGNTAKVYRFSSFETNTINVIADTYKGEKLVVCGSKELNFLVAYKRTLDGQELQFTALQNASDDAVMEDQEGNRYNVFGEAVAGPRKGQRLNATRSFIGYWFSWGTFYPEPEIYGE